MALTHGYLNPRGPGGGHTLTLPQASRPPTPIANATSSVELSPWSPAPPTRWDFPLPVGVVPLPRSSQEAGWSGRLQRSAHTSLPASLRASPTSGPRTFWLGMGPMPSPHPRQPPSGSSSVASSSGASPSCCGSGPSSASWPTASRLPWRTSHPTTT